MKMRRMYFIGSVAAACLALILWCAAKSLGGKQPTKSVDGHSIQWLGRKRADIAGLEPRSTSPSAKVEMPPALRQLWDDPSWRSAHLYETTLKVEGKYGRLFSRLSDWSPERLEALNLLSAH
jgi:hypothetical protein